MIVPPPECSLVTPPTSEVSVKSSSPATDSAPSSGVTPLVVLPEHRPGVLVRHKLNKVLMIIIEMEGDGTGQFFTARSWDMQTWRLNKAEVDIEPEIPEASKHPGQYL